MHKPETYVDRPGQMWVNNSPRCYKCVHWLSNMPLTGRCAIKVKKALISSHDTMRGDGCSQIEFIT